MTTSNQTVDVPLYATQGGGYATRDGDVYVWHSEIPSFLNAQPGDTIPREWGIHPVNEAACDEIAREEEDRYAALEEASERANSQCAGGCGAALPFTSPRARDAYCSDECYKRASAAADLAAEDRNL